MQKKKKKYFYEPAVSQMYEYWFCVAYALVCAG